MREATFRLTLLAIPAYLFLWLGGAWWASFTSEGLAALVAFAGAAAPMLGAAASWVREKKE